MHAHVSFICIYAMLCVEWDSVQVRGGDRQTPDRLRVLCESQTHRYKDRWIERERETCIKIGG